MRLTGYTTSDVLHMDVLHRMHCIGYSDNVVIRHNNNILTAYSEYMLLNMLILKVNLKAKINLSFKSSDKNRHAITLHCIIRGHI